MKGNLKLAPALTFKAIEARACKAAALAAVKSAAPKTVVEHKPAPVRKVQRKAEVPSLEREIRSIFRAFVSKMQENNTVATLEYVKGAACKAKIRVFRQEDFDRQKQEDKVYHEQLNEPNDRKPGKPYKAAPVVEYALYPGISDSTKLGSIAIYGEGASFRRNLILKEGRLFGHSVTNATLEMGRRLFVVVRLAA